MFFKKKLVKEASDIDFRVRAGKREEIPDPKNDQHLVIISTLIKLCWNQNPNERPPFKQIDQKLSPIKNL